MVATLVRLRLLVLRNSFRRSTSQLVAVIIGALYGAFGLIVALGALVGLSFAPAEVATTAVVTCGAGAVCGAEPASPAEQPASAIAVANIEGKRTPFLAFIGFFFLRGWS